MFPKVSPAPSHKLSVRDVSKSSTQKDIKLIIIVHIDQVGGDKLRWIVYVCTYSFLNS